MSPAQRALWTFLLFTLIGPFLAAVATFITSALLIETWRLPAGSTGWAWPTRRSVALAGGLALWAFVVGAFVAAIAGAGLAALTSVRGSFGWLAAAVAGVLAFMAVALGSGAVASSHMTLLAFLAACIALVCRAMLVRIGIQPRA